MQGNALVPLVMFGWIPFVLYMFARYPAQRAVIACFIIAWMFLPQASLVLPGIPDYDRMSATCYGILLATLIFDVQRITTFRYSWIDIPMTAWCFCPLISSISNDLGAYDGFASTLDQTMSWGAPYFLGRIYLNDFSGLRKLAIATFVGAIVYMPLCLYEARMFTNIHLVIYGFQHPSSTFLMSIRYGGYRPSVFMVSGLMLSVWMMLGTLMGIVLWRTGALKKLWNVPAGAWVGLLLVTFVLIRSTGAYLLIAIGVFTMFIAKWFRTSIILWILIAGMVLFLNLNVTGQFPRKEVVGAMSQVFERDRVQSVDFRFMNEELLGDKARQRIVFGWGGFGRNRIFDEYGKDISITDSLWIIVFGVNGLVGLISIFTAFWLPPIAFSIRYPARLWSHPAFAPAAALAVSVVLYSLDCILNAMANPIFALTCGGIAGVVVNPRPKM